MPAGRLSRTEWLICAAAAWGFAFDTYELLALPLVMRPAIVALSGLTPGSAAFNRWVGLLLYLPAVCGGIFGLLGGILTDRFGRRRLLLASIVVYSVGACASALVASLPLFLVLRCLVWSGIAIELVAGVTYVAEMIDDPRAREIALGVTQSFGPVGGLLVSAVYYLVVTQADSLPAIRGTHEAWRYTLLSGLGPALPLLLIRPWLPESKLWAVSREKRLPATARLRALFAPELRGAAIATALVAACSFGAALGGLQHVPRIVPGLADVAGRTALAIEQAVGQVQLWQELGGLAGRVLFVWVAVQTASRRTLLRSFQVPTLILLPIVLFLAPSMSLSAFTVAMFFAGLFSVGMYSFFGNYLPALFPTAVRGTGESFAINVGGRMIGSFAALLTTELSNHTPGVNASVRLAYAAAAVVFVVGVAGFAGTFALDDTKRERLS